MYCRISLFIISLMFLVANNSVAGQETFDDLYGLSKSKSSVSFQLTKAVPVQTAMAGWFSSDTEPPVGQIEEDKELSEFIRTVENKTFSGHGLNSNTIMEWLEQPEGVQNEYNGEYYFESPKIPDSHYVVDDNKVRTVNPFCVRIDEASQELRGSSTEELLFIKVKDSCDPLARDDWKTVYVVKKVVHMPPEQSALIEIDNLRVVRGSQITQMAQADNAKLPIMTYEEGAYKYIGEGGSVNYFTVLDAAQGVPLMKILDAAHLEGDTHLLMKAFFKAGEALASMHLFYMDKESFVSNSFKNPEDVIYPINNYGYYKTVTHHDAHQQNLFYNEAEDRIYLIDTESMRYSLTEPISILSDIERFYLFPLLWGMLTSMGGETGNVHSPGWHLGESYAQAMRSFFEGYVSQYPSQESPYLANYLAAIIDADPVYFKNMTADGEIINFGSPLEGVPAMISNFNEGMANYLRAKDWSKVR